ncbi:MAG: PHP domain-containing protein [Christensenellaceae bacterium]|nr:PHP domain-containing protein [Christensenellaceae bacterium]
MLNIYADYHTHTDMSHGTGTARENIEAAIALGLKRIAISDHSIGHAWYGIRDIDRYVDTVLSLKEEYKGKIDVLLGIELNLVGMKGDLDIPEKYADKFDIKLLGYHKCGKQVDLISAWQLGLRRLTPSLSAKHTKAFEKALATGLVDILAHPGYAVTVDKLELAHICERYGVLYEINNKHPDLTVEDIKNAAEKTNVRFVIGTDAHASAAVGKAPHSIEKTILAGIDPKRIDNAVL